MSDGTAIQWTETKHLPDPDAIVLVLRVREDTMSEPLSERGYYWTDAPNGEYEILFRPDGTEVTTITEPENRISLRDLAPVCVELNTLQAENARLLATIDARDQEIARLREAGRKWHAFLLDEDICDCEYFEGAGVKPCDLLAALEANDE